MAAAFYRDFQPEDLPVPNQQVMQLIQYTLRDDAEVDTLTKLISVNPTLTAQLLGLVNSAFFGFRSKIQTISEAVIAVGMDGLRNLVLCFAVKDVLSDNNIPGFDIDMFWEDSIRRAVCAKQIGYLINGPIEEAFTAGMLQDIGLLILFSIEPDKVDRWPLLRASLPAKRIEMENELFRMTHDQVGSLLGKTWNLPGFYNFAIGYHHSLFDSKSNIYGQDKKELILASMMYLSDLCNSVYASHDKAAALNILKKESKKLFDLSTDQVEFLLSLLPDQVEETSRVLHVSTGSQIDFEIVMEQANRKLIDDNISYQELTSQLQNSLKQRDEYAAKLEAELEIAREIQQSLQPDPETVKIHQVGAFNIPAFHLSGDFYDYFVKPDGTICFCLGDVSGKGTSAALLMAKAISLFRCINKVEDDISTIVQLMNNELCETAIRGMFVTFIGGWFYPETNQIKIINAGHLPPFLVGKKSITEIKAVDPPLGIVPGTIHAAEQFSIQDSRLFLYTDGFTEGRLKNKDKNIIGSELGFKGFLKWIIQSKQMPIHDQMEWVKKQCDKSLTPHLDDVTMMIVSGE